RLVRPLARRLRPGRGALPALRDAHAPGVVHGPLLDVLPHLPAPATHTAPVAAAPAQRRRMRRASARRTAVNGGCTAASVSGESRLCTTGLAWLNVRTDASPW